MVSRSTRFASLIGLLSCLLVMPAFAQDRLGALLGDGGVILQSPEGEELLSINSQRGLVPASILKIPLAQVALTTLGAEFRFETHFYRNRNGDLLIRGMGDPFLVSEEIAEIVDVLVERGLQNIQRLVVDDSAFASNLDLPLEPNTDQPYGARNGALAVNFNTVNIAWTAEGELISGEPQTPLTAFARELSASRKNGGEERINLGNDSLAGVRQAEQLFRIFLERANVNISDSAFYHESVSDDWSLFYRHENSQSLPAIIEGMLRYSNNFTANQIFLTLGAQQYGYPATMESARLVMRERLLDLYGDGFGSDPETFHMVEGSGLSREQRSSAAAFVHILEVFKPYAELLPEVGEVRRKSGTLTGVYNFAGYLQGEAGLHPFVILTNQAANNRAEILRLLQRLL